MRELQLIRPGGEDALPVVVTVESGDGAWTPGPCVGIEAGNQIELTLPELTWLVEDAGPRALEALRGLTIEPSEETHA